jgi:hypothetical protein
MPLTGSSSGMESLEISDLPTSELVRHAATILKVDLQLCEGPHAQSKTEKSSPRAYTFREQWVLKWLLRRFVSEESRFKEQSAMAATGR